MAANNINPLPPTIIYSTAPISTSSAHDFLSKYLERAATDPALQPDASITEHGPTSRATASAPNLVLHNLKRVLAGMGGEFLGKDLMIGEDGSLRADSGDNARSGAAGGETRSDREWEDATQYEQGGYKEQSADAVQAADQVLDKEERKKRKKERRLAEKKARNDNAEASR